MKNYYRLMLGKKSVHAEACFAGNFIGVDFDIGVDLTHRLPDEWRDFNAEFIPVFLKRNPDKTKIGAGLACGALWTVSKGIKIGDVVLCPDGTGRYRVGEVISDYQYVPDGILPHRRAVHWSDTFVERADMGDALRNSSGAVGTVCQLTRYANDLDKLIAGARPPALLTTDPDVQDPAAFAMEKHLEDFLVKNWAQTDLGREFDIFEEDGERVGQQYPTDTGPLDVLAISKDKKRLLVVELKKGRASDAVVGQTLRYMGFVNDELADDNQTVQGVIIAAEDDPRLRRALSMVPSIGFYKYQVSFKLVKA
jgi:restriction system protein